MSTRRGLHNAIPQSAKRMTQLSRLATIPNSERLDDETNRTYQCVWYQFLAGRDIDRAKAREARAARMRR